MNTVTTNLADFGYCERADLIRLLAAWHEQGLPDDFSDQGVHACLNKNSGYVFLTNDDYEVCLVNDDDELAMWLHCGNCGHEGFAEDCVLTEDGCTQCCPNEVKGE